jgi:hypothetical protein
MATDDDVPIDLTGLPPDHTVATSHALRYERSLTEAEWRSIERSPWLDRAGVGSVTAAGKRRELLSALARLPDGDQLPRGFVIISNEPPTVRYDRKLTDPERQAALKWAHEHGGVLLT